MKSRATASPPAGGPRSSTRKRAVPRRVRSKTSAVSANAKPAAGIAPPAGRPIRGTRRFVILTGLSGAGKTHAVRALEDLGYFCVDNLPTTLIPMMAELAGRADSGLDKVAIVARHAHEHVAELVDREVGGVDDQVRHLADRVHLAALFLEALGD